MLQTNQGFQSMLKEGYRHYAGLEEAILRNIEAAKELSQLTRTSYGPNGMKKMVVNHIDKVFVTCDCITILKESEINHPAGKLITMAAKMQKEDFGDATNYVMTLAGELLSQAELLIKSGLHPSAIISGYKLGLEKAIETLEKMSEGKFGFKVDRVEDEQVVERIMTGSLSSKIPNHYEFFGQLLTKACLSILQPSGKRFNADNVRFIKLLGSNIEQSSIIPGFVISRAPEGFNDAQVNKAKIACYNCPFDPQGGETKGTVLITNAQDLVNYSSTEEALAERIVKEIAAAGVNVVVVGGSISELCLHYLNKYGIFVLKVQSKFELARLAKTVQAQLIPKLGAPIPEEIGNADCVKVEEIGSTRVTIFEVAAVDLKVTTMVLRGATTAIMDDIERALMNGVDCFKQMLKDNRYVNGAASTEAYMMNQIEAESNKLTGLEQYSCNAYGQSFEVFVRMLLENAGLNANEQSTTLVSKCVNGPETGVDVFQSELKSMEELKVLDHLKSKQNAIKLASQVVLTILRIDQIIVAKPSGGPKFKENKGWDND